MNSMWQSEGKQITPDYPHKGPPCQGAKRFLAAGGPAARGAFCFIIIMLMMFSGILTAAPAAGKKLVIKDYRKQLNRKFKKKGRKSTQFIIVHTSEAGLTSTLRTLSQGKVVRGRYRTVGGHSHYTIARNGRVYRLLNHRYRADHAGRSMWNGVDDISSHSLAIELVGYHYGKITDAQYRSLGQLVKTLRRMYRVKGKNVLTHSQVSYGKPNRWHRRPHRGRKRCGLNFDRSRIGLGKEAWTYDPDVKARRLVADTRIYAVFYKPRRPGKKKPAAVVTPVIPTVVSPSGAVSNGTAESLSATSNIISKHNSAWNIAGDDYDSPETFYILPDKREIRGDRIAKTIGWNRIPRGTQVMLNQPMNLEKEKKKSPILKTTEEFTAWSYAGKAYKLPSTFYFFPNGGFVSGTRVTDWDSLPIGTRIIMGYREPVKVGRGRGRTPWSIAGRAYNRRETLYYIPRRGLRTGDTIRNFNDLPRGTNIFLKQK